MILIQNILNGNQLAEETLYNRYRKIVRDFILSKYSTYYDLDDDVSEIMIKVFLNLKVFDVEKSKFKSWVLSITKNYMIDKWRSTGTLQASSSLTVTSTNYEGSFYNNTTTNGNTNCLAFTSNAGFSTSCSFENCNTVNFISTQLSPSDFTLLDMKYVQGYDYKEIGSEFQITSSTVSNKINYIKTKLKKTMQDDIYD